MLNRGSGLAVALASSDWQTRRAAAEALQALAIAFGPALDTEAPKSLGKSDEMAKPSSLRASAALNGNCRYDKVRMVRTAATEASAAYTYVQVRLGPVWLSGLSVWLSWPSCHLAVYISIRLHWLVWLVGRPVWLVFSPPWPSAPMSRCVGAQCG